MPQMAPINWLILFLLFNLIIIFINSLNHYMFMKYKNYFYYKITNPKFIWKW